MTTAAKLRKMDRVKVKKQHLLHKLQADKGIKKEEKAKKAAQASQSSGSEILALAGLVLNAMDSCLHSRSGDVFNDFPLRLPRAAPSA